MYIYFELKCTHKVQKVYGKLCHECDLCLKMLTNDSQIVFQNLLIAQTL